MLLITCNLDRLGAKYVDEGDYNSAIRCYEAMTGAERALGTKSIRLADALTDLAMCYAKVDKAKQAYALEQMAVDMRREVLSDQVAQLIN